MPNFNSNTSNNPVNLENQDPDNIIPAISSDYYKVDEVKQLLEKQSKAFSVFHCNIRSLNKNLNHLEELLVTLGHDFSIIGISETKLSNNTHSNVDLPNYNFIRHDSITQAGGVGLYINNNVDYRIRDDLSLNNNNYENLWIEVTTSNREKNLILGIIYRHPHTNFSNFNDSLSETLNTITNENKQIIIMGDINIDLIKSDSHQPTGDYVDMLFSNFCFPVITKPTRITYHTHTLIDHIYTNNLDKYLTPGICLADISDHLPVFLLIDDVKSNKKERSKKIRDFKTLNKDEFLNDLKNANWDYDENDVNISCANFMDKFISIVDKHAPYKTISKKEFKLNHKPWISSGILKSIQHKQKMYISHFVKGTPNQKLQYKQYANKLTHVKEMSKKYYFKDKLNKAKTNVKETWKIINQITKLKSKSHVAPHKIYNNGEEIINPHEIANQFNNFFRNIGPTLADNVGPSSKTFDDYLSPLVLKESFFTSPTNRPEIESMILKLDVSKASGPYDVPIHLIKLAGKYISKPLSLIYNLSFLSGIFPNYLKLSRIIPLYKSDSPHELSNYRPISLLSPFSKILEKLMYKRLLSFINKHNILYKYQFGFRKSHSTTLALIEITDNLLTAIDNGLYTCGIFIDFSKAFDTINHDILLSKLNHYGVRGNSLNWFKSYLNNRLQFVDLNGIHSNKTNILCGVPQGSILGPLLFIIYVNDIANCSKKLSIRLFADDTNCFLSNKDINMLINQVNIELNYLSDWIKANKLSLNIKKSKYMIIASPNKSVSSTNLILNGSPLQKTDTFKYLGVIIDKNLTWKNHINIVCKKISKNIGILSKLRHYLDTDSLKQVYYSLIYPYLQYGLIIWGNTYKTRLNQLHILNNKAIRLMTFSSFYSHAPPLYKALGILQLKDLTYINTSLFMHDYINNKLPIAFLNYYKNTSDIHNYYTRSSAHNLYLTSASTNYGKFSMKFIGVKTWNSIPENTRKLPKYSFKKEIKQSCLFSYV